ncbi:hypothetical protein C4D60_Mb09t21590 [Musa balbisiana]|uniref:Uncharacterized protein n=1 Tax=Musa balbisiana TaxID=52838 RepID=A0A4S8IIT9_MUSBA|nr:hypothetical protein C4D60_Mb09t21590 [Musa balbisiana]
MKTSRGRSTSHQFLATTAAAFSSCTRFRRIAAIHGLHVLVPFRRLFGPSPLAVAVTSAAEDGGSGW